MSDFVQYIIVRKDLIDDMGVGKTAAQVAHASLGVLLEEVEKTLPDGRVILRSKPRIIEDGRITEWLNGAFTKLVVYVKTKQKLLNLAEKLDSDEIRAKLIWDSCRTALKPEEPNGTTLTCMGIIPLHRNKIPKYLQKLRLL